MPVPLKKMLEPIYSLTLSRTADGHFTKAAPSASFGLLDPVPLGAPYADVFRKTRAPTPRELVQQLVGTAYACASLNADLLGSTDAPAPLPCSTRPGEAEGEAAFLRLRPRVAQKGARSG